MVHQQEKIVEQTLVLIKPDGLAKSLTGNIISSLSETELKIVGAKVVKVSRELAEQHYNKLRDEKGEEIFEEVLKYIQGYYHTNRVLALIYQGEDAISKVRSLAGATNPESAVCTTIRGKFGRIHSQTGVFENVMHCSDGADSAEREIKLWFNPWEITEVMFPVEERKIEINEVVWKDHKKGE